MKTKLTATQIIHKVLEKNIGRYMACHEICTLARRDGFYISDNAAASRLNEMNRCMEVDGRYRDKARYKEWAVLPDNSEPEDE